MTLFLWAITVWGSGWSLWWIFFAIEAVKHRSSCIWQRNLPAQKPGQSLQPLISIIVTIHNEAKNLEQSLNSLLAQDCPLFEIIAVNDRSTDESAAILNKLVKNSSKLKAVHIDSLPDGWVGKCHALDLGFRKAKGEIIIFTDADVVWSSGVLRKIVSFVETENIDYLSILHKRILLSLWERVFVLAFYNLMNSLGPIWEVKNPDRQTNIGIGSFMLFRRKVLERLDGMKHLKLSVTDDVSLAQASKAHGFKCRVILDDGQLKIRWQEGLWGHIKGLEKNFFATFGFQYSAAGRMLLRNFSINLAPFLGTIIGFLLGSRLAVALNFAGVVSIWIVTRLYHCQVMDRFYELLFLPLGAVLSAISLGNSIWKAKTLHGCKWKGKIYPLEDLISDFNQRALWLSQAWENRRDLR